MEYAFLVTAKEERVNMTDVGPAATVATSLGMYGCKTPPELPQPPPPQPPPLFPDIPGGDGPPGAVAKAGLGRERTSGVERTIPAE